MAAMSSPNRIAGALMEQARPYGQRSSIIGIFAALRDRFSISAVDARSHLQRLLRKENTPLQDHTTIVKRLVRIAYSDLPETQQPHYILDDFTQSLNDSWRFCVDYRKLNSVTIQDAYPLPRIDESLDALASSKYFSALDLLSGYWQVPLSPDAQEKAAFITRDGLWKWKVLTG